MMIRSLLRQALTKMNHLMIDDSSGQMLDSAIDDAMIMSRFWKQCQQNCRVGPSLIAGAGLGVFCNQKTIKQGTILSLYPVHCLGLDVEDSDEIDDESDAANRYTEQATASLTVSLEEDDDNDVIHGKFSDSYLLYILGSRPLLGSTDLLTHGKLFVNVDPGRPVMPGWVAHLVNDGAVVHSNSEEGLLAYYEASARAKNCALVPFGPSPIMALVATRKIRLGEEFLTSYGGIFWLEKLLAQKRGGDDFPDITEAIQHRVQLSALDSFRAMQGIGLTYQSVAEALQRRFDR